MTGQIQELAHVKEIDAASGIVFDILDDAANWQAWARPVVAQSRWERWGDGHAGGVGGVRAVGLWPVFMREQILEIEPGVSQKYTMVSPDLFDSYVGQVRITPLSESRCRLEWQVRFESRFGSASGKIMRQGLSFVIGRIVQSLADAAESK